MYRVALRRLRRLRTVQQRRAMTVLDENKVCLIVASSRRRVLESVQSAFQNIGELSPQEAKAECAMLIRRIHITVLERCPEIPIADTPIVNVHTFDGTETGNRSTGKEIQSLGGLRKPISHSKISNTIRRSCCVKEMPEFAKRQVSEALLDLCNSELQQESWIQGSPGGPTSPTELVCELFDDTGLSEYLADASKEPVFTIHVDDMLRQIESSLTDLDLAGPPSKLLEDKRWREVQALAGRVVRLIAEETTSSP